MWESTVINASAERDNSTKDWTILTFGGLARLPKMTRDGYIIVLGKALADSMEMIKAKVYNEKPNELTFEKNSRTLLSEGVADDHPISQCRLNTFFQASLCDKNVNDPLSDTSDSSGICSKKNGDSVGLRPDCWFNPKE